MNSCPSIMMQCFTGMPGSSRTAIVGLVLAAASLWGLFIRGSGPDLSPDSSTTSSAGLGAVTWRTCRLNTLLVNAYSVPALDRVASERISPRCSKRASFAWTVFCPYHAVRAQQLLLPASQPRRPADVPEDTWILFENIREDIAAKGSAPSLRPLMSHAEPHRPPLLAPCRIEGARLVLYAASEFVRDLVATHHQAILTDAAFRLTEGRIEEVVIDIRPLNNKKAESHRGFRHSRTRSARISSSDDPEDAERSPNGCAGLVKRGVCGRRNLFFPRSCGVSDESSVSSGDGSRFACGRSGALPLPVAG